MNKREKLAELRHSLAHYGLPPNRVPVALGHAGADAVLGGGLRPGALHEVFACGWSGGGFAAALAMRAAGNSFQRKGGPLFWVRPDYEGLEYGAVSPNGLAELGGDPRQLILVRARKPADALSAASDILSCPHVGALLLELEGMPKCLDLVASRRLAFAASESGVTVILLREGAQAEPSAALTRWQVKSAPSRAGDEDWGNPVFDAHLVRHRLGGLGHFLMQWNPEHAVFVDPLLSQLGSSRRHLAATSSPSNASQEGEENLNHAATSKNIGAVAAAPADRPAYPQERRAV
jgi:protein ImuA